MRLYETALQFALHMWMSAWLYWLMLMILSRSFRILHLIAETCIKMCTQLAVTTTATFIGIHELAVCFKKNRINSCQGSPLQTAACRKASNGKDLRFALQLLNQVRDGVKQLPWFKIVHLPASLEPIAAGTGGSYFPLELTGDLDVIFSMRRVILIGHGVCSAMCFRENFQ